MSSPKIDILFQEGKREINIARVGTALTPPSLRRGGAISSLVQSENFVLLYFNNLKYRQINSIFVKQDHLSSADVTLWAGPGVLAPEPAPSMNICIFKN